MSSSLERYDFGNQEIVHAYVMCVDIVGFSKMKEIKQVAAFEILAKALDYELDSLQLEGSQAAVLCTGDGFILITWEVEHRHVPLETAVSLSLNTNFAEAQIDLTFGISSGVGTIVPSGSSRQQFIGPAINTAVRVQSLALRRQILATKSYHDGLVQHSEFLEDHNLKAESVVTLRVKHGEILETVTYFGNGIGISGDQDAEWRPLSKPDSLIPRLTGRELTALPTDVAKLAVVSSTLLTLIRQDTGLSSDDRREVETDVNGMIQRIAALRKGAPMRKEVRGILSASLDSVRDIARHDAVGSVLIYALWRMLKSLFQGKEKKE